MAKPRGSDKLQGYIAEMKPTACEDWSEMSVDPVREPNMVVPHLKDGQDDQFQVTAVSEVGPAALSTATRPVIAEKPPGLLLHYQLLFACSVARSQSTNASIKY